MLAACTTMPQSTPQIPVETFAGNTPRPITKDNLIFLLSSGTYEERLLALQAVSSFNINVEKIIPYVVENLYYQYGYRVRVASAYALGEMGSDAESTIPDLLNLLQQDDSIHVRREAATALGKIGHVSAIPYLAEQLYYEKQEMNDIFLGIRAAKAIEQILNIKFTNGPDTILNEKGIPIIVINAKKWWEAEGQFQTWPEPP